VTVAVYIAIYAGLAVFLLGSAWRAWAYAHLPVHLRWELYPVPHEEPKRVRYGGSSFEEQESWRRPQRRHIFGELRMMAEEILLFKGVRDCNRRLWLPSYLFHMGIYLVIAAVALAAPGAFVPRLAVASETAALAGAALIVAGACLLLVRRLLRPELRNSTHPGDIFNLLFFLATFVLLIAGFLLRGQHDASWSNFAHGLLCFDTSIRVNALFASGLILTSALADYIPFTHMAHFVAKYFTWHEVRWDDRPSDRGGPMEREVSALLAARPDWSAPHVGAAGPRTWAEIATAPTEEMRK
jgi:nitrate reductase gamma subunit